MEYDTMKATVKGTTCGGDDFVEHLLFTLVPPKEGTPHYGTGCYMTVKGESFIKGQPCPYDTKLIDVRYERTTDIEILADRFIQNYYGSNVKEVAKTVA